MMSRKGNISLKTNHTHKKTVMYHEISAKLQLPLAPLSDCSESKACECLVCMNCAEFMYMVSTSVTLALPVICKGSIEREIPLRDIFYKCTYSDANEAVTNDHVCQRFTIPLSLAIDSAYSRITYFRGVRLQPKVVAWWGDTLYDMIRSTSVCGTFALLVRALLKNNIVKGMQVRGTNNKWQIEYDAYTNLLAIWIGKYELNDCVPKIHGKIVHEHTDWVCSIKWAIQKDTQDLSQMLEKNTTEKFYIELERIMAQVCGDGTLYYRIRGTRANHVLVRLMVPRIQPSPASRIENIESVNLLSILDPFVEPLTRLVLIWLRVYGSDASRRLPLIELLSDSAVRKKVASTITNMLLFNFGPEETRGVTNKNLDYFSVNLTATIDTLRGIEVSQAV
jgi:hypothetical protein